MRRLWILAAALCFVPLLTTPAAAFLTNDGDIVWNLTLSDGYATYHGSLTFAQGSPIPTDVDLTGVYRVPVGFGSGIVTGGIQHGVPGLGDVFEEDLDWEGAGANGTDVQGRLLLRDQDGLAFAGAARIPGQPPDSPDRLPPIDPPSLSLFETHSLDIFFVYCSTEAIDPSCGLLDQVYTITALPEPSTAALALLGAAFVSKRRRTL
jgi:hypothetical protein